MANRNTTRRENYKKLRAAGFSPREANRWKGSSAAEINRAVKNRQLPPVNPVKQAASKGKKKETINRKTARSYSSEYKKWVQKADHNIIGIPPRTMKGRITYESVNPLTFNYQSNYSYVMAFQVKHPDGSREWKYITLVSSTPKTKKELDMELRQDIIANYDNMTRYESTPLVSTITLVQAFRR